jgi:hypothetical protein
MHIDSAELNFFKFEQGYRISILLVTRFMHEAMPVVDTGTPPFRLVLGVNCIFEFVACPCLLFVVW